jgi:hypothetical protein
MGQRKLDPIGISRQPIPVPLEGKGHTLIDAQGGEYTPAVEQSRLPRTEANFLLRQQTIVVKNESMHG